MAAPQEWPTLTNEGARVPVEALFEVIVEARYRFEVNRAALEALIRHEREVVARPGDGAP